MQLTSVAIETTTRITLRVLQKHRLEEGRNTVRNVITLRLGARERDQIAKAAARRELALSSFIRQAALQASAVVSGKASVVRPARAGAQGGAPATNSRQEPVSRLVVIDPAPAGHWAEGEFVTWPLPPAQVAEEG